MRKVLIAVFLVAVSTATALAQDFKNLRDGVEYAEQTKTIDGVAVQMNLLRLDLKKVRLDVFHAMDAAIGVERTSSIATRHGAYAAINAGFFRLDASNFNGEDVGTLIINGQLLSESYAERTSLGIVNKDKITEVSFRRDKVDAIYGLESKIAEASGINRERKIDEVIIYTPHFGRSTLTSPDGIEITVQDGKVIQIADGKGSNEIPERGFVISASGKFRDELRQVAKIGQRSSINTRFFNPDKAGSKSVGGFEDVVAGVPRLVRDGKVDVTWQEEKSSQSFAETKHPRTAVALLNDGRFLMLTVDGRSEASGGISLQKLAELMVELGAKDAMNLDGGGSTTMFLDGKVVNKPSDKEGERRISSAILVFPR